MVYLTTQRQNYDKIYRALSTDIIVNIVFGIIVTFLAACGVYLVIWPERRRHRASSHHELGLPSKPPNFAEIICVCWWLFQLGQVESRLNVSLYFCLTGIDRTHLRFDSNNSSESRILSISAAGPRRVVEKLC